MRQIVKRTRRCVMTTGTWTNAARLADFEAADRKVVSAGGRPVLLLRHDGGLFAVDNRCPHMAFPLEQGSVKDCILTCHWHHARFDLASGGTFDQFADDVRAYPVELRGDDVWIDLAPRLDERAHQIKRLQDGLERDIRLVEAKAAIALLDHGGDAHEPFRTALLFGVQQRRNGWGQGLTMLTCFMNMLPHRDPADRPRALYHGLNAVSVDAFGMAPRFMIDPLPNASADPSTLSTSSGQVLPTLKRWFRQFIEVRDDEGAERCVVSAIRAGATAAEMADMLFAAITDHRYIQIGHPADFANKALEALDIAGWQHAEPAQSLLADDPRANVEALLAALRDGATPEQVAGAVAYAAALRMARFHTANEFGDWDTVLHTFTFANAIHQAIRRVAAAEHDRMAPDATAEERALPLLRGVLDAAMSVYLDRFLNTPPARLPKAEANGAAPDRILAEFLPLLDRQQQVNEAGTLVARYLATGGDDARLLATLGQALAREDRDFHTIQTVEAAFAQHALLRGTPEATHALIAAARYLAAHSPTVRAEGQTFQIAERLHRGEKLYEENE